MDYSPHSLVSQSRPSSVSSRSENGLNLAQILIDHGVDEFIRLQELKQKGWQDDKIDGYFANQRYTADNASPKLEQVWFDGMKRILSEIDDATQFIPREGSFKFLDLGFCPGGFTSELLASNSLATGVGVSLPLLQGGHRCLLGHQDKQRMRLIFHDLTRFQLGPNPVPEFNDVPSEITTRSFDLALLDGHFLRTQTSPLGWDAHRLLVSQIILAFQCVVDGGTIVMKLSRPDIPIFAKILCMFDGLFSTITTYKPRTLHMTRGTFYLVARGFGHGMAGDRVAEVLSTFRDLWVELTFSGEFGTGRFMRSDDLDFAASDEEISGVYLERLIELGLPVWRVQRLALESFLKKQGSRHVRS